MKMESNYTESSSGASMSNELNLAFNLRNGSNAFSVSRLLHTAAVLNNYYTPLLCLFGSMGNCLSVIVFSTNANHRSLSSSYYLSALAISDTGFLVNLFALWLDEMGVEVLTTQFGCPFIMFSGQVTCFLSVWLTVAFTIERFFAVCYPLTRPRVCTVSKAKKVICGLTGFALIAFSYALVIARVMEVRDHDNFYHDKYHYNSTPTNQFISPFEETATLLAEPSFNVPTRSHFPDREGARTSFQTYEGQEVSGAHVDNAHYSDETDFFSLAQNEAPHVVEPSIGWINKSSLPSSGMINDSVLNLTNDNVFSEDESVVVRCTLRPGSEYMTISTVANYLDSMITLIIPFCLIAFFNIRITLTVWKLKDERKNIVALPKVNNINTEPYQGSSASKDHRVVVQATKTGNEHETNPVKPSRGERRESHELKWRSRMMSRLCACRSVLKRPRSPTSLESPINAEVHVLQSFENNYDVQQSCFQEDTKAHGDDELHSYNNIPEVCPESTAERKKRSYAQPSEINVKSSNSYQPQHQTTPRIGCNDSRSPNSAFSGRINGKVPKIRVPVSSSASETRVTKMLLLVSTVFLVLNLPSHALRAASFIQTLLWRDDVEGQLKLFYAQNISNILLFNTNFAVNFLLYCLSGRNFRKSLRNIFLRKSKKMALNRISRKSKAHIVRYRSDFGSRKADNETVIFDDVSVGEQLTPSAPVPQ